MDCATGSGQLAQGIAGFAERVVALDASPEQIANAVAHPRVRYRVAAAEATGLDDHSVDLLTVGQALHWFDHARFVAEAERILVPGGLVVVVSYATCKVTDRIDGVIDKLYRGLLENYWPPERAHVEDGYAKLPLPGRAVVVPSLDMTRRWSADDMLGYLRTWSASRRYERSEGQDPVSLIEADLVAGWGAALRPVRWPLTICASRIGLL